MPCNITVLLLTVVLACRSISGAWLANHSTRHVEAALRQHLFGDSYNPYILPRDHTADPVNISMQFTLNFVLEVDTIRQVFHFNGWFDANWTDPALAWDTDTFPITKIFVPPDAIWKPDLFVENSIKSHTLIEEQKINLILHSDGSVQWFPGGNFATNCPLDIRQFPFDEQVCPVQMQTWVYAAKDVMFLSTGTNIMNRDSSEWTVLEVTHEKYTSFSYVSMKFSVRLKRRWVYYWFRLLMPVLLVSALNCGVQVLPWQSGEKMGASLAIFLTLTVLMTEVQASLPNNAQTICFLSVFVAAHMVFGVLSVFFAIVSVLRHCNRNHSDGRTDVTGGIGGLDNDQSPAVSMTSKGQVTSAAVSAKMADGFKTSRCSSFLNDKLSIAFLITANIICCFVLGFLIIW